jgi:FtsH-binding integral membrane protein
MIQEIYNRIQTAWKSLPSVTRTILLVTYDFMVCEWLVLAGAILYFDYLKKRSNFWLLLTVTLVVSVAVVFRNLMWVYKSNAQAKYIARLKEKNNKIAVLMTQIFSTGEKRPVGAPQCVEQDIYPLNDLSEID